VSNLGQRRHANQLGWYRPRLPRIPLATLAARPRLAELPLLAHTRHRRAGARAGRLAAATPSIAVAVAGAGATVEVLVVGGVGRLVLGLGRQLPRRETALLERRHLLQ
jgi:hypothetical protein